MFYSYFFSDLTSREYGLYQSMIMIGVAIIFFYFILWKPEQKRRRRLEMMRASLKKGDIVIAMGIRATVDEIKKKTVILRQIDGSKMEILPGVINEIEEPSQ